MRLAFVLVLLSSLASADELTSAERQARAHAWFERGRASFKLGDFTAAVREFEEGYKFAAQPLFLYNIAQSARRAGLLQKAVDNYRAYLLVRPDAPEKKECEQRIAELEKALPPPVLEAEKPRAVEPSPSPEPVIAPPPVAPAPVAPPAMAPPAMAPPAMAPPAMAPIVVERAKPIEAPKPNREKKIAGAVLTALGLGALGGGVACTAIAVDANRQQHDGRPYDPSLDARGSAANTGQIVLYVMGGAALVGGVVLLAITARDSHRRLAHR